jgi:hypothetical protein
MGALKYASVLGQPEDGVWSQAASFPYGHLSVPQAIANRGWLLVALEVVAESDDVAVEEGRAALAAFEKLFSQEKVITASRIYAALQQTVTGSMGAVAAYVEQDRVTFMGKGGGSVVWWRNGGKARVFASQENWSASQGQWQVGDRFLFGTASLISEMADDLIDQILTFPSVEVAGEELVARIQAADTSAGAAGMVVHLLPDGMMDKKEEVEGKAQIKAEKGLAPAVFLRQEGKRKRAISIGLALLLLLAVSMVGGWRKQVAMSLENEYVAQVEVIEEKLKEARMLKDYNQTQAKQLVIEAQDLVEAGKETFANKEAYRLRFEMLEGEALEVYELVSGETKLAEVPEWFDLTMLREGMFGTSLVRGSNELVALDSRLGLVGRVKVESKQAELVGGGELLAGARLLEVAGQRAVVLASVGVVEVAMNRKTAAVMVERDEAWGEIRGLGMYNGNLYLADAGHGEIWRYPGLATGVGGRSRWLGAGVEADFKGMSDMVVDGDIWIAYEKGMIRRYRRGAPMNFTISGMETPLGTVAAIYTDTNMDRLYVLDQENRRVVILNKEGVYQQQLLWEGIAGMTDLVVDEALGRIYLLSGVLIYAMEIPQ